MIRTLSDIEDRRVRKSRNSWGLVRISSWRLPGRYPRCTHYLRYCRREAGIGGSCCQCGGRYSTHSCNNECWTSNGHRLPHGSPEHGTAYPGDRWPCTLRVGSIGSHLTLSPRALHALDDQLGQKGTNCQPGYRSMWRQNRYTPVLGSEVSLFALVGLAGIKTYLNFTEGGVQPCSRTRI